jgi:hypothetical protein
MKNTPPVPKEQNASTLDDKSKRILDEFVNSCLALDIERVKTLFSENPEYIKEKETPIGFEIESESLVDRIEEIFNEFRANNPTVTVKDRDCTGCSRGQKTKLFTVTYKDAPSKASQFGFLIKQENNSITEIYECIQYKSYQDKLAKRMYAGKTDEEIKQMKEFIKSLPEL